jgi:glycosyl hydrolase family 79
MESLLGWNVRIGHDQRQLRAYRLLIRGQLGGRHPLQAVERTPSRRGRAAVFFTTIALVALLAGGCATTEDASRTHGDPAPATGASGAGSSLSASAHGPGAVDDPPPPSPPQVTVTVGRRASVLTVPPSYLGISTEYWAIPLFARRLTLFERTLRMLHAPGAGPFILRIGGDSTDHSLFDMNIGRTPRGIFELDPHWFHVVGAVAKSISGRLILDLNLVTDLPRMAGQWAEAAIDELPRGSIAGFEIGNEPDLYSHHYWLGVFGQVATIARVLPLQLTPLRYVSLYGTYARVLSRLARHIPLLGPAVAYPVINVDWVSALLEGQHPGLRTVSAHMYPYSNCAKLSSPSYPTIARLLSERATAGVATRLGPAVRLAHREGLPFRLTELNSVTCGGTPGVSNTLATALWAPDALFELMRAGVDGVNVHVRAYAVNAAFGLNRHGMVAHPLMYGLLLFTRMLGPGARLVAVGLHAHAGVHLKAWAVRVAGGILHVLLINKGRAPASVALRLPAVGAASVQRLLAPSVTARSGVTLDGQTLGRNDTWRGRRSNETLSPSFDGYALSVPATSAALVTARLANGAL